MSLTLNQVANIIIEASQTKIPPQEDPESVDFKSRNLIFALRSHQDLFDPNAISFSLIADLMGIDFYNKENARKLIEIIKSKLLQSQLNPAH
ncbi:MAG: hypothetical protein ACD_61C00209G0013 [uncultured bacterium]|nr:MAG: hypothetical protein ACD_61C00209G0013 [uncultured bacterium]